MVVAEDAHFDLPHGIKLDGVPDRLITQHKLGGNMGDDVEGIDNSPSNGDFRVVRVGKCAVTDIRTCISVNGQAGRLNVESNVRALRPSCGRKRRRSLPVAAVP